MKNWIIGGLVVALAGVSIGAGVLAQSQRTANVEVRVWEDVNDPERNYISARPEGGSWRTLGTIPLPLTDGVSSSGRFRYGDITLAVPLPDAPDAPTPTPTPVTGDYEPWTGQNEVGPVFYDAAEDEFGRVRTYVYVYNDRGERLNVRCWPGTEFVPLAVFVDGDGSWRFTDRQKSGSDPAVLMRLEQETAWTALWNIGSQDSLFFIGRGERSDNGEWILSVDEDGFGLFLPYHLVRRMAESDTFLIRFGAERGYHTSSWDITGMANTPAWENITRCGTY